MIEWASNLVSLAHNDFHLAMNRTTTRIALAAIAGIAAFQFSSSGDDSAEGVAEDSSASNLSTRNLEGERVGVRLSKREIVARMPEKLPMIGSPSLGTGYEEKMAMFVKLGALEGEAAVDFIFNKYGNGQSTYLPMTFAMTGWMENDLEAGLAAFKGFLKNGQSGFAHSISKGGLFQWKGKVFHSGMM